MLSRIEIGNWTALGLVLALGANLNAQDPLAGDPWQRDLRSGGGETTSLVRGATAIWSEDGALNAGGSDYQASFVGGGMRYLPALGARASRNYPWQFTLESIRRGSRVLHAAMDASAPSAVDGRVVYRRGEDIEEIFTVRPDGIELSYTFARELGGQGDLIVRGRVNTELYAAPVAVSYEGLAFHLGGIGGVDVGGVTGIDAAGAVVDGHLRWDGEFLELVLPGSFVDQAVYPLVLDPLVGTSSIAGSSGNDDFDSDVAYDSASNQYLVVWTRSFSATNRLIRAQRINGNTGARIGSFIAVTGAGIAMRPAVANVRRTGQFLVCWQDGSSPLGPFDISCRTVRPGGTTSGVIAIASTSANEIDPDVGGDSRSSDDEAVVVWNEEGAGIRAAQVTVSSTGDPSVFGRINVTTNANDRYPAIPKSGGAAGRFAVVFERFFSATSVAIYGQAISINTTALGNVLPIAINGSIDEDRPDVDGDGTSFMVVFSQEESAGGDRDIFCRMVRWNGSDLVTSSPKTAVEEDSNDDERTPAVAYLGPKYLVAWADESFGFLNYDIGYKALNPSNCLPCGFEGGISSTRTYDAIPEIASKRSGNSSSGNDDALITFSSADRNPPFTSDVLSQRFSAFGTSGSASSVGGGCGTSGTIGTSGGPPAIGNTNFTIRLTGADPAAAAALFQIALPGASFNCGPCGFINPALLIVSLPPAVFGGGNGAQMLPIPCNLLLNGGVLDFQFLMIGASANPCPIFPGIGLIASDKLRVTIGI